MNRVLIICLFLVMTLTACGDNKPEGGATPAAGTTPAAQPAGGKTEPAKTETSATKHPWANFKVGSSATTKTTTALEVGGKAMNTSTEIKQTLVELTADKAVVEVETDAMGAKSKTKLEVPLTASATSAIPNMPADSKVTPKQGEETITVKGKAINCKWYEVETEQAGNKISSKTWMSSEVPGSVVKSVTKTTGAASSETTLELVDYEVK